MNMRLIPVTSLALAAFAPLAAPAVRFNADLAKMAENREAIRKVIADPKAKPSDVLLARYDDLKWDLYTCEDKDFPAKKAAMLKLVTERGDTPKDVYLGFLYSVEGDNQGVVRLPDVWPIAERETRGEPKLRTNYYKRRLGAMRRAAQWRGTVDPAVSAEARLRLVDEMEKDPDVDRTCDFDELRFAALVDMGSYAEAERMMLAHAAETNVHVSTRWLAAGLDFYRDRAARYYSEPDPATLRKLIGLADRLVAWYPSDAKRRDTRRMQKAYLMGGDASLRLGDTVAARKSAEGCRSLTKDGRLDFEASKLLASVAFAEERWDEVVETLAPFADKLNAEENMKCAQALNAANRRREAIPYLERAIKKCRNKYKRDGYSYLCEKFKAEAAQGGK